MRAKILQNSQVNSFTQTFVFESIAKNDPLFKNIVVPSQNSNELELDDDKGTRLNSLDLVGKHYLFRDINDKNV